MHPSRILPLVCCAAAALVGLTTRPGLAQPSAPAGPPPPTAATTAVPVTRGELLGLETFLDRHPFIEARLRENPNLVNDPAFRKNHPLLADLLARNPNIIAELAARPRWFIHRELVRQCANPVTAAQVAEFDRFLDRHPRLEHELALHPQWLRNPEFLKREPELRDYLQLHPGIGRAAEFRPRALMEREQRHERPE
ncbi:MAG TPA: hypothetical protein VLW52_17490 [Opitutaceae bacterium]|nr:hypothetical protein [Opitutaceae bacterium]